MAAFLPESDSEDELPPGWEERATISGEVYYANHQLSSTQWDHPRTGRRKVVDESLPFGWDRQILSDNKVVYVDLVNKRTTYTDPRLAFAKEKISPTTKFRQKWDASTTAQQVLHGKDLSDRIAMVTGACSGVGFQVARSLVLQGCQVIFACRTEDSATYAMSKVLSERPNANVSSIILDLASLASVRRAALQLKSQLRQGQYLDYLVLSAATFPQQYLTTEDGLEMMMQVNFISHAYLVILLTKMLCSTLDSRVVFLSAESHRFSSISSTNIANTNHLIFCPGPTNFCPQLQYNDTKLACILFSTSLHRRFESLGMRSMSVHPGNLLSTSLYRYSTLHWLLSLVCRPFTKSTSQAAASVVMCLVEDTSPSFTGYVNNCFPTKPSQEAESVKLQEHFWEITMNILSEKLGPNFNDLNEELEVKGM